MTTPQDMADYYEGYPDPEDAGTWGTDAEGNPCESFEAAQAAFEAAHGPAPAPPVVPGPPAPGAGMPAARVGDLCAHGGAITGPGFPSVLIGFMPAVRAMPALDQVACPMFNGPVPHATGTILKGSNGVLIGFMPAARVSDPIGPPTVCAGNQIAMGFNSVLIGDAGGPGGAPGRGGGGGGGGGGGAGGEDGGSGGTAVEAELPPEPTYADSAPTTAPPGESTQNVGTGTHWIEIEMVDEAEQSVAGEQYLIVLPDGKKVTGGLDEKGQVHIGGIKQPGWCRISFPNLDLAAWQRWSPAPSTTPSTAGTVAKSPAPPPAAKPPVGASSVAGGPSAEAGRRSTPPGSPTVPGSGQASQISGGLVPQGMARGCGEWRRVMQGECISSIAKDTGHFWQTIWDHAANAELKLRRRDPNVLMPGDAVLVPNRRAKEDSGSTDQHHKFRRRGEPAMLHIQILHHGVPQANEPFTLEIDGQDHAGVTDAEGHTCCSIPGNARRARLIVGQGPRRREYSLMLGGIDPITTLNGVQSRLNNLGFDCGSVDGHLGSLTKRAIEAFQARHGLELSGQPDEATRFKLLQVHGI